jgi:hypothetical protein
MMMMMMQVRLSQAYCKHKKMKKMNLFKILRISNDEHTSNNISTNQLMMKKIKAYQLKMILATSL